MGFTNLRRAGVVAASLGMAAAALAVTAPAAGAAISQGRIQLCSQGNYKSWLTFKSPNQSSTGTDTVSVGSCTTFSVPGSPGDTWSVTVHGVYNTSGASFTLPGSTTSGSDRPGLKISTVGTTTSPSWKFLDNN